MLSAAGADVHTCHNIPDTVAALSAHPPAGTVRLLVVGGRPPGSGRLDGHPDVPVLWLVAAGHDVSAAAPRRGGDAVLTVPAPVDRIVAAAAELAGRR